MARLREYGTALEAGIALVLAEPEKRAVHKLRTAIRRVEAQLILLGLMGHDKEISGKKFRRSLKQVRRACGRVRDYDVQAEMLAGLELRTEALCGEAAELLHALARRRGREAAELGETLRGHAGKLPQRLEETMHALQATKIETLTGAALQRLIAEWYGLGQVMAEDVGEDELHDLRKRAKLARYLAESGGMLKQVAREYKATQDALGVWHDRLMLRGSARKFLGKKAGLTLLLKAMEEAALVGVAATVVS